MTSIFEYLMTGLDEIEAFLLGKRTGYKVKFSGELIQREDQKRKRKLSSLVFITEEKHGRPFLDAPMPRAYIKYLAQEGLKVTIEYVRHV